MALRHAPALRSLGLGVADVHSLNYIPLLTQLTHLDLIWSGEVCFITAPG
jgi:hypothetical protein